MKILISESRVINLVGSLVNQVFPNFTEQKSKVSEYSNGDDSYLLYYDPKTYLPFAKFYFWRGELELSYELYFTLKGFLGNHIKHVIDWFNKEFNQDAETVTF